MTTQRFIVIGMSCGHCVHAVTGEFTKLAAVSNVTVDLPTGTVTITATRPISADEAATAADEAGYELAS